jgi:hypothetical protein
VGYLILFDDKYFGDFFTIIWKSCLISKYGSFPTRYPAATSAMDAMRQIPYCIDILMSSDSTLWLNVSGGGAGVDSAWEQKKLEARKILENRGTRSVPTVHCTLCWAFF